MQANQSNSVFCLLAGSLFDLVMSQTQNRPDLLQVNRLGAAMFLVDMMPMEETIDINKIPIRMTNTVKCEPERDVVVFISTGKRCLIILAVNTPVSNNGS